LGRNNTTGVVSLPHFETDNKAIVIKHHDWLSSTKQATTNAGEAAGKGDTIHDKN
jgi:hypothetical protein